ncbi:MerR family transcriptional regulator [Lentzea sp. DG1S-22]|uniref:MerR family transcriptional regulator n=1 Tax=Lentzea sp. DG1S-22 TaxID=3108822 RepID=UPI002E7985E1|nr:MerR family transcriptional regulator [Lentzea sp. DG1S-22]WVH82913.1 MerR family transcriptional regulator [Lentzea sp. DG1S-22]
MGVTGDGLRIAGLSGLTQVSIPTIKFYLRSGLLHPGRRTGPNQMRYDESHVRRLRVVRALVDRGGLPVAAVAELVGGSVDVRVPDVLTAISRTGAPDATTPGSLGEARAKWRDRVDEVLAKDGREVADDNAAAAELAGVLASLELAGHAPDDALLEAYLRAGAAVAAAEADQARGAGATRECAERLLVSIVLGAVALTAARRLGHDLADEDG